MKEHIQTKPTNNDIPADWCIEVRSRRARPQESRRKLPWLTVRNGQLTLIVDAAFS